MKNSLAIITILFSLSLIVGAAYLFGQGQTNTQISHSDFVLSGENLVPALNRARIYRGVYPLTKDPELTRLATERAVNQAQNLRLLPKTVDSIDLVYTTVAPSGDYYDVDALVQQLFNDYEPLISSGTKVGAWVSYVTPIPNGRPITYVTVIIK